jgi:hypothetical protein
VPLTGYSVTCSPPGPGTQLVVVAYPSLAKLQLKLVSDPLAMRMPGCIVDIAGHCAACVLEALCVIEVVIGAVVGYVGRRVVSYGRGHHAGDKLIAEPIFQNRHNGYPIESAAHIWGYLFLSVPILKQLCDAGGSENVDESPEATPPSCGAPFPTICPLATSSPRFLLNSDLFWDLGCQRLCKRTGPDIRHLAIALRDPEAYLSTHSQHPPDTPLWAS